MMEKNYVFKNFNHKVKDLDEKEGIVTIYMNSFDNEDSDGDISVPGSFKRTFKNNIGEIWHLLNHNTNYWLGIPLELKEDDFGAIAVSQMNMEKQIARDVFEDYKLCAKHNRTLQHSIRVNAIKRDTDDQRKVLEWKLWEYSTLYSWGANPETPMIDIKSLDELEIMMREGNYSDEKAKQIEQLYDQLKELLNDPSDTPGNPLGTPQGPANTSEKDPSTLESKGLIETFYNQLKF